MAGISAHLDTVAEAIWRADENAHERGWWEVTGRWREHYRRLAQAAIGALRLKRVWSVGTELDGEPVDWLGHDDSSWRAARDRGLCHDQFMVSRLVSPWVPSEGE